MSRGMVVGVSVLISSGYVVWVLSVFIPWMPWWWTNPVGMINLIYLHFAVIMLVWSYYATITTDPGAAQPHWRPMASEEILSRAKEAALEAGKHHAPAIEGVRYCVRCKLFKPPRSHHCRKCQRCVLKLDHHCPWVNNCVGYYNHKSFLLFCFWCVWTISHYHIFFGIRFYHILVDVNAAPTWLIVYIVCFCVYCPTTLMIASLLAWQIYLLFTNRTSVEWSQEQKALRKSTDRKRTASKHPYDLGVMNNFKELLGPSMLLWLAPLEKPTGDGIRFKTNNAPLSVLEDA